MRSNKGFILKIFFLCLSIIGAIVYFECFQLKNLIIEGGSHYSEEEIRSFLVQSKADEFTHVFYLKNVVFSEPDPVPFIEKFEFEIVDRNTVHVTVYDKVVIGCVEHMGRYMHFDREGIVVESANAPDKGVPVITGIDFSKVVIGEVLEVQDPGVFKRILELTLLLNKYEIECDRIHFDIRGNIKLFIGKSEALLGGGDIHDYKITALKNVLKSANGASYRYDLQNYTPESGEVVGKPINNDE